MANADNNSLLETLGEVISNRLKSATDDQVASVFDLLFGKTIEKLSKSQTKAVKQDTKKKEKNSETEKPNVVAKDTNEKPQQPPAPQPPPLPAEETNSKLQKVEKPVIIGGFNETAIKSLQKILPESLSDALKNLNNSVGGLSQLLKGIGTSNIGKGFGMGALGVLGTIFSLFTLLDSLKDTGPFKGLKMLIGRLSLGAVTAPFRMFFSTLKALKDSFFKKVDTLKKIVPEAVEEITKKADDIVKGFKTKITEKIDKILGPITKFFSSIYNKITGFVGGIFNSVKTKIFGILGKEAGEVGAKAATAAAKTGGGGFFKGLLQSIGSKLKFIPFIGALFSIASAWSRFKTGDIFGGAIDILSTIANFIPFGTPISIGLTALNAVLDYKAGGSDVDSGKAKPKGDIFWGWIKNLGNWFLSKIRLIPGVGDIIDGIGLIFTGKAEEGFEKLPIIGDLIRAFKDPAKEFAAGNVIAASLMSPIKLLMDVIVNSFTGIIDGIKVFLKKILKYVPGALIPDSMEKWMKEPEAPKPEQTKETATPESKKPVQQAKDALIDPTGGLVVSSPKEGALFQLSKNDGVAAGPWTNKTDVSVNIDNKILTEVAKNTKVTNEGIVQLANGFMALAKQLGVFADKAVNKGGNVINNVISSPQEQENSADIVRRIGATPITQLRQTLAQSYNPV